MAAGDVKLGGLVAATATYVHTKNPEHSRCNPARWLNQRRRLDKPATLLSAKSVASPEDSRVDLGGGIQAPYSTMAAIMGVSPVTAPIAGVSRGASLVVTA